MTAYKAQGKTLDAAAINLVDCHGTESAYVMVSRVTSLDGLVIISPFSKEKICCRTSEDLRNETDRIQMLALQTVIRCGTAEEIAVAKNCISTRFSLDLEDVEGVDSEDENTVPEDSWTRLSRKQHENLLLIQPRRRQKRNLDAPLLAVTGGAPATGAARARALASDIQGSVSDGLGSTGIVSPTSRLHRRKKRQLDDPLVNVSVYTRKLV
jgi:hypothetical protein